MKKVLALTLALSLLMTAGCGHDENGEPQESSASESEQEITEAETSDESSDEEKDSDDNSGEPDEEPEEKTEKKAGKLHSEFNTDDSFITGEVSEEVAMENSSILFSVKPDADGFIIKDGVLYDYEGDSPRVDIPDSVERIAEQAFWGNDVIEALYIPSSVKIISPGAFWSCSNLKFVQAEEGLEAIGGAAFWSCSGLEDVNLPESLDTIGVSVFGGISGITLHVPKDSAAEEYALLYDFAYDNSYAEYTMLDRENVIVGAQYAYGDFEEFIIPENIIGIESDAFEYCENLKSIFIPSNVQYISPDAFEYCSGLKEVTIDGCREIKAEAFEYCDGLETVRINEGTESIGESAFAYCDVLSDIYLPGSVSSIDKRAFEYTADGLTLHVPAGSYAEEYAISMNIPYDNNY